MRFSLEPFVEPVQGRQTFRERPMAPSLLALRVTGEETLIAATREARAILTKSMVNFRPPGRGVILIVVVRYGPCP
jgi:hypothetical protein